MKRALERLKVRSRRIPFLLLLCFSHCLWLRAGSSQWLWWPRGRPTLCPVWCIGPGPGLRDTTPCTVPPSLGLVMAPRAADSWLLAIRLWLLSFCIPVSWSLCGPILVWKELQQFLFFQLDPDKITVFFFLTQVQVRFLLLATERNLTKKGVRKYT